MLAACRLQSLIEETFNLVVGSAPNQQRLGLQPIELRLETTLFVAADDREAAVDHLERCIGLVTDQQGRTQQHQLRRDAELIATTLILVERDPDLVEEMCGSIRRGRADAADRT